MLKNIMYVTVYVTDQDRALKFYTEGLGLELRVDAPGLEGRFLTVGVPDTPVEILLWKHAPAAGQPAEPGGPALVPGPIFLESADLRKDVEAFRERGVPFDQDEPVDYPFGVRIEAVDPDGNRISLRERRLPPQ
jgi:catechol 2,3-dioxygenase-like lactoylglutathione lyase family enzyme